MTGLLESAFLWGLVGGVGYAGTKLASALYGGPEIETRAIKLAIWQCLIAMFLSPFAAYAGTPMARAYFPTAAVPPVAFMIGLSFNAVWPLLIERGFLREVLAGIAQGFANRLSPGAPDAK